VAKTWFVVPTAKEGKLAPFTGECPEPLGTVGPRQESPGRGTPDHPFQLVRGAGKILMELVLGQVW